MSSNSEITMHLTYNHLSQDVHELIFHSSTVASVTQCYVHLHDIFAAAQPNQPILLLTNFEQSDTPPLFLLRSLTDYLFKKYPQHPVIYDAIIKPKASPQLLKTALELVAKPYRVKLKFFGSSEQEQALRWLLEQRDAKS